jgi:nitroreductase
VDVFKAIEKRNSYRGPYKDKKVPRKDIEKIVEAGIRAPSGYNRQTTSFVIGDDPVVIKQIGEIMGNERVGASPAVIVVIMDTDSGGKELYFGIEDYGAAVENVLLAVTSLGYASVWIDGSLRRENRAKRIAELLGVPEGYEVRVVLPVGVPAEQNAQKEKKPFAERAWYNRYGG